MEKLFLALVSVQALHSIEEYVFELWTSFPPAAFVTGLVSSDLRVGFIAINLCVVALGFTCYWLPIRGAWPSAVTVAWVWTAVEFANGIVHPAWSIVQGGYTPGALTSLLLLPLSLLLARELVRVGSGSPGPI